MKVKLTGEELKAILSSFFKCEVTDFTLIDPDPSPLGKFLRERITRPLDKTWFVTNIKVLRKIMEVRGDTMNLTDARWAIENWPEFLRFIDQYNRVPFSGYGSSNSKGKLM